MQLTFMMFGADPEFTVVDAARNPVPAHRFFPPKEAPIVKGEWSLYRDGYMLEVGVRPHPWPIVVISRIRGALRDARGLIPKEYSIVSIPAVPIDLGFMKESDTPGDLMGFGCEPSYNAYTCDISLPAVRATEHPWRYAGEHMHFGLHPSDNKRLPWFQHEECRLSFIKMLDKALGLPLAFIHDDPSQYVRRKYYGMAGEFRLQKYPHDWYGVEYRTPTGVFRNSGLASWSYGIARWVVENYAGIAHEWDRKGEEATRHAINTGEGLEELITAVPGFYDKEMLMEMKKKSLPFVLQEEPALVGWKEWMENNNIHYPGW